MISASPSEVDWSKDTNYLILSFFTFSSQIHSVLAQIKIILKINSYQGHPVFGIGGLILNLNLSCVEFGWKEKSQCIGLVTGFLELYLHSFKAELGALEGCGFGGKWRVLMVVKSFELRPLMDRFRGDR